jgi:hypothetical protein
MALRTTQSLAGKESKPHVMHCFGLVGRAMARKLKILGDLCATVFPSSFMAGVPEVVTVNAILTFLVWTLIQETSYAIFVQARH